MKFNEHIAVATNKVLLVPYDARHVPRYHEWMEDATIREATASERLALDEEYANQVEWREAADKLTFILCEPLTPASGGGGGVGGDGDGDAVVAGEADEPRRMVGDVNMFLTPWEGDGDDEGLDGSGSGKAHCCMAEIDIMIADPRHRGKGLGRAAVAALLSFFCRNREGVLAEYGGADGYTSNTGSGKSTLVVKDLVAKISAGNTGSIALFKSLGFEQRGGVNYFGEIQMVLEGVGEERDEAPWVAVVKDAGYKELRYDRSRLREE